LVLLLRVFGHGIKPLALGCGVDMDLVYIPPPPLTTNHHHRSVPLTLIHRFVLMMDYDHLGKPRRKKKETGVVYAGAIQSYPAQKRTCLEAGTR
jgi:hypothetical protein